MTKKFKANRAKPGEALRWIEAVLSSEPRSECVLWPFSVTSNGYGSVYVNGKNTNAHRYALQRLTGSSGDGLLARHGSCHNRLCVNPLHLEWGTPAENQADKDRDGTDYKGTRHPRSKLSEDQVLAIHKDMRSCAAIGREYGVSHVTVHEIRKGKIWKHLHPSEANS